MIMTDPVIARETRAERIERAMHAMTAGPPSTKGMGPRDRAECLYSDILRRAGLATEALRYGPMDGSHGDQSDTLEPSADQLMLAANRWCVIVYRRNVTNADRAHFAYNWRTSPGMRGSVMMVMNLMETIS